MSDASVEISFRADLTNLESGLAEAAALIGRASDEILQIAQAGALKEIAIAEDRNDFLLRMGEESLAQWKANAVAEENAKLAAELAFLDKKAAADRADAAAEARDLAERQKLYATHALALQKIDEQAAERKRQAEQQELSDFLSADTARLQDGLRTLEAEFREHKITADQRFALEQQLTSAIYGEEVARLNALIATLTQGTKAYENAIKERQKLEQDFTKQSEANTNQLETTEAQKWTQLSNSIKSSFNSALDGMIFEGKSFGSFMLGIAQGVVKAFLSMGETIAENWIATQIAAMFETKATQGESALGQVSDAAAVAGANAYAQYAAYPPVAMAMAGEAIGAVMSFTSLLALDVGAWDLKNDTVAQLHKGEMVVPQNFASGLRANGGLGGGAGGDVHMNYSPHINAKEPATLSQMLVNESSTMLSWLQRQMRNGSLRA